MIALVVVEALVLVLLGVLVAGLLRSHAEILRILHGLGANVGQAPELGAPTGARVGDSPEAGAPGVGRSAASDVVGESPDGEVVVVSISGAPHRTFLAFLSSGCLTCNSFWSDFARSNQQQFRSDTRPLIVTKGPDAESVSAIQRLAPGNMGVVMSTEAWDRYAVPGSPYFVLVDGPSNRVLGKGTASRWDQLQHLIAQADDDTRVVYSHASGRGSRDSRIHVDSDLLAAGIYPGHPSLYPQANATERTPSS
jgi:hypothetical protein